jgi:hypothetical protein
LKKQESWILKTLTGISYLKKLQMMRVDNRPADERRAPVLYVKFIQQNLNM